jgi:hypothetical protein
MGKPFPVGGQISPVWALTPAPDGDTYDTPTLQVAVQAAVEIVGSPEELLRTATPAFLLAAHLLHDSEIKTCPNWDSFPPTNLDGSRSHISLDRC